MRRLPLVLSMVCVIVLSAYIVPASAQSTTPRLLAEIDIGDSTNAKYPNIAVSGQMVYIGSGVGMDSSKEFTTDAYIWSFTEEATSIGPGLSIGIAKGKRDYNTAAVATASDGTLYAIWSDNTSRTISVRHRDSSGTWGARRIISSGGFPVYPKVAVNTSGQVFAVWQDVGVPLFLRVSNDQGVSWSSTYRTSKNVNSLNPLVTVGPNGQIVIGFTTIDFAPAIAIWTGSGLTTEVLGGAKSGAMPGASIGPDGKIYAAWRAVVDTGPTSGLFYAERQGTSWVTTHLLEGKVLNTVNLLVDSNGSVHLGWNVIVDVPRFFYSVRQAGQTQFSTAATPNTPKIYNSHLALSPSGAFVHVALEKFTGTVSSITYARFSGPSVQPPTAAPKIENDAPFIKQPTTVSVSFTDVTNSPTEIRWRWSSAPTDAATDSGGWQAFATPMTIGVPSTVSSGTTCSPVYLYTQVRTATQMLGSVQSDGVVIDTGVTASVRMTNPHLRSRAATFTNVVVSPNDIGSDSGASDGDPTYTREPMAYVEVQGANDCSGVKDIAFGRSTAVISPSQQVSNNFFANVVAFPGTFATGSNTVMVRLTDNVGNSQDYSQVLTYDTAPPVLNIASSGTVTATSNLSETILSSLQFSTINVTDAGGYPGRGFWGVWMANSRTAVTNPITDTTLIWTPVAAPGTGTSFTLNNWSLANGLPSAQLTTGNYTIYARFLDGAGAPTTGYISTTLNLTTVTMPKVSLPLVKR